LQDAGEDYIIRNFITCTLHKSYWVDEIKEDKMGVVGHIAHVGEMRNLCKILVGKPEGKRPLRQTRHGWECIIRMNLREIRVGRCGLDTSSGHGPVAGSCEHSNEQSGSIKGRESF
jgi:hypothetical protein